MEDKTRLYVLEKSLIQMDMNVASSFREAYRAFKKCDRRITVLSVEIVLLTFGLLGLQKQINNINNNMNNQKEENDVEC